MSERPSWTTSFEAILERHRGLSAEEREAEHAKLMHTAELARREQERAHRVELAKRHSDLDPGSIAELTLDRFRVPPGDREAHAAAVDFVESDMRRGPLYCGPCGVGKTHLVAGIIIAGWEMNVAGAFKTAQGILDLMLATHDHQGRIKPNEPDYVSIFARVPLLVLDDLDKAEFQPKQTPWLSRRFYTMLDERYKQRRPLLGTSNMTPASLGLAWQERGLDAAFAVSLIDRLCAMCEFIPVEGHSYRQRGVA